MLSYGARRVLAPVVGATRRGVVVSSAYLVAMLANVIPTFAVEAG